MTRRLGYAVTSLFLLLACGQVSAEKQEMPEGFEQIIPRGAIPALIDPTFVPAAKADVPDAAWVLGFAKDGEAYAYDLNILNSHEIVNHEIGGEAIAAVW